MDAFKTFTNFEDGLKELCAISNTVYDLFMDDDDFVDPTATTSEGAIAAMMDLFMNEGIPTIYDEDFPNSRAISVSATEFGLKCTNQIAFGWKIRLNYDTNETEYRFRLTVNAKNVIARNTTVMKNAQDNGWNLVEREFHKNNYKKNKNDKPVQEVIHEDADEQ